MKIKRYFRACKVLAGISAFAFLLLSGFDNAKAESVTDISGANKNAASSEKVSDADMDQIMSALDGQTLVNGDSIVVDNKFKITCEVTIIPTATTANNSLSSTLASTASSTTNSYTAYCNCYVSTILGNVNVATIQHNVTVISYDTGKIHISYGSLSATPNTPSWTTSCYGYSISNTDGSYSSASGTARLYNTPNNKSAYYNCFVSVTPGHSPSFSFTQF